GSSHLRRQPQGDDGKGDQDDQPQNIRDDERQHAIKNGRDLHVLDHAFYDEDVHADGRVDQPELHRHDDDDAEPDRVEAQLLDDRKDDGDGEDDHGQRIHQAAEHQIHDHDHRQDAVAADAEAGEELLSPSAASA